MVAALQEFIPDVILTDHSLPTFAARDALELGQQLAPGTPIIVVTGRLGDEPPWNTCRRARWITSSRITCTASVPPCFVRSTSRRIREAQTRASQLQAATYALARWR